MKILYSTKDIPKTPFPVIAIIGVPVLIIGYEFFVGFLRFKYTPIFFFTFLHDILTIGLVCFVGGSNGGALVVVTEIQARFPSCQDVTAGRQRLLYPLH